MIFPLNLFKEANWLNKKLDDKVVFLREHNYLSQFYDDVATAARYHHNKQRAENRQNTKELILITYETAIAYANFVHQARIPDMALDDVVDDIEDQYSNRGLCQPNSPLPIYQNRINGDHLNDIIELGLVIRSMFVILCFDILENKDEKTLNALKQMRNYIYLRNDVKIGDHEWNFWEMLRERMPDNRYPSEGELRQRIKKLEEGKKQLEQEVLKLENIAADETEEERDDEEVAEGRFPHRITVGYLLSLMGIKSKENIKNQAALKRALQGLTGVSPTSVNNYLEGFNLALRNNQSELDRLNKELRDAGLPEFHIELDSE